MGGRRSPHGAATPDTDADDWVPAHDRSDGKCVERTNCGRDRRSEVEAGYPSLWLPSVWRKGEPPPHYIGIGAEPPYHIGIGARRPRTTTRTAADVIRSSRGRRATIGAAVELNCGGGGNGAGV